MPVAARLDDEHVQAAVHELESKRDAGRTSTDDAEVGTQLLPIGEICDVENHRIGSPIADRFDRERGMTSRAAQCSKG